MRVLRTYARVYGNDPEALIGSLVAATGQDVGARFAVAGLEVAAVGRVLAVAGDGDALEAVRDTAATLVVDDLDDAHAAIVASGGSVVRGPAEVPTGRNLTAVLSGGTQLEYVEWSASQWARVRGNPEDDS